MDVASRCSLIIQHAVSHSFIVSSTLHSQCFKGFKKYEMDDIMLAFQGGDQKRAKSRANGGV